MSDTEVVFQVSEDDGSDTYYWISRAHIPTLEYINGHTFLFEGFGIRCGDDKSVTVSVGLSRFLKKFRNGHYIKDWNNIARKIQTIEIIDEAMMCPSSDYHVFLGH